MTDHHPFPTRRPLRMASVALIAASLMLLGQLDRPPAAQQSGEDPLFYRFVDVAAEVFAHIDRGYVDPVERRVVLESAMKGMFKSLDRYSQYLAPSMMRSLGEQESGVSDRTGLHIKAGEKGVVVTGFVPDSPAALSGLLPGDTISMIDGTDAAGWRVDQVLGALRGPAGTTVRLEVARYGRTELLGFDLVRANVVVKSVYHRMQDDGIGYVRLTGFDENSARDVRRAVLLLKEQGLRGLILDLRFNGGGLVSECVEMADLFIPRGAMITSMKGRLRDSNKEYIAQSAPVIEMPMFVLVNKNSASASEMLSGCLQDHGVAVIVGPSGGTTHGKGCGQQIHALQHTIADDNDGNPMEAGIRLTTLLYYLPSGRTIHEIGVKPDIEIAIPDGHEDELRKRGLLGDVPDTTDRSVNFDAPFTDIVLEEASKQLKVYMILRDTTRRSGDPTLMDWLPGRQKKPKG